MGLIGALVDFLPADILMGKEMLVVSTLLSSLVAATLIYLWVHSGLGKQVIGNGALGWFKASIGWLCVLPIIWFIGFLILGKGLPWAYTRIFGHAVQVGATLRTTHSWRKRHCDYRAYGSIQNFTAMEICISKGQYLMFPDRQVSARLVGKESALGFAWNKVELMPLYDHQE